jgi:hypothetical protein
MALTTGTPRTACRTVLKWWYLSVNKPGASFKNASCLRSRALGTGMGIRMPMNSSANPVQAE